MPIAELFHNNPEILAVSVFVLGLIVGSFLNVVIHRLPLMMEHQWRQECATLGEAGSAIQQDQDKSPYNLVAPGSSCPECGHAITAMENIPLLSFLFLRGRCSECGTRISVRYPAVELLTGLLSAYIAWHFGLNWQMAAALFFSWCLIALTFIDLDRQLLPDSIVLPLMWTGLLLSIGRINDVTMQDSLIGAAAGYLSLWLVYHMFRLVTGKEGMGYGDFKLLAALGAWMGWKLLPLIVILSTVAGALTGIMLILLKRQQRGTPVPFGPFLGIAGIVCLFWGQPIMEGYLKISGL
jgi:leader peptidase (prepilin peptidase)/N-methyltransferase